jgi:hypothetical protein
MRFRRWLYAFAGVVAPMSLAQPTSGSALLDSLETLAFEAIAMPTGFRADYGGLNNDGMIVGLRGDASSGVFQQIVLYQYDASGGGLVELGVPNVFGPGGALDFTLNYALNDAGQIAGTTSSGQLFIWTPDAVGGTSGTTQIFSVPDVPIPETFDLPILSSVTTMVSVSGFNNQGQVIANLSTIAETSQDLIFLSTAVIFDQ